MFHFYPRIFNIYYYYKRSLLYCCNIFFDRSANERHSSSNTGNHNYSIPKNRTIWWDIFYKFFYSWDNKHDYTYIIWIYSIIMEYKYSIYHYGNNFLIVYRSINIIPWQWYNWGSCMIIIAQSKYRLNIAGIIMSASHFRLW